MTLELASDPGATKEIVVETTGVASGMVLTQNALPGRYAVSLHGVEPMRGTGSFLRVVYRGEGEPIDVPFTVSAEANEGQIAVQAEGFR